MCQDRAAPRGLGMVTGVAEADVPEMVKAEAPR